MISFNENLTIWEFEPTPPLPTYLFAFSVGRFRSFCENSIPLEKEICIWRFSNFENWHSMAKIVIGTMAKYQVLFLIKFKR